ncbi:DMT family transporter [Bradyrhizobium sp. WD16]|uniref:DMT family transporter n=1 Tax=Bradyrhizobium sp. WD16 TaxID=1521768 RepID=UPI0020A41339|nr:DMT family transporter [Bradyrhizobium sp. WD16]UTD30411.1 EamA family transporter [Bradyrhizobium sp. WD16]
MAGWLALMLLLLVAGRVTMASVNLFEVLELRSLIGFALLAPMVWRQGGLRAMATARPLQHICRNTAHYTGQYLWFLALTMIPIAQVVSIEFTMPIWTALLAAWFLGEHITLRKTLAIGLGLIGVVVIVRPGVGDGNAGQLVMVVAAMAFAIAIVLIKSLTRTDPPVVIIFWMLVIQSVLGLVPSLVVWTWPPLSVWPWLVVLAFCGTYSHYCMTQAMRHADATVVVPMDFLRVPLSAAVGWLVYDERLDLLTVVGAAVILGANLLNLGRGPLVRRAGVAEPSSKA